MVGDNILDQATQSFENLTCKLDSFLSIQEDAVPKVKKLTKVLYDFTKSEDTSAYSNALPELIIQDFDEEQIWQEIELQNEDKWTGFLTDVSKILSKKSEYTIPITLASAISVNDHSCESEGSVSEEIETLPPNVTKKLIKKKKSKNVSKQKTFKDSIVDDQFFKLRELEAFLDAQDKEELKKDRKPKKKGSKNVESSEEEDEEEEIDYFADSDDEGMMDDDSADPKEIKYKDFFGDNSNDEVSDSEEDNIPLNQEALDQSDDLGFNDDDNDDQQEPDSDVDFREVKNQKKTKNVRFDLEQPSSGDDDDDGSDENENTEEKVPENLSELQLRQQRLKKKIGHIEDMMFEEKAWPMKGEVSGSSRPQNSLLEEVVDFDSTMRPAPVITEETTLKLQDIIIQRIKDKAWDDVVRKIKPVEDVQEFKKQLVLDQEKSKLSLAQVYEQEYIKQREALDPDADEKPIEEPKEHIEIQSLINKLFTKLDALCNYHYTPKIAAPEVKIVSNMPAINMEEVAPVATSDATLLAPEEIRGKAKGDVIGKTERTDTDKKRERRQKKIRQREKERERQKKEKTLDKMNPGLGNKYSREKASRLLDKVTKDRNVEKMEKIGDGKSLKSSSAFFTQLQEEVSSSIKSTLKRANSKKNKNSNSAKRMKL